MKLPRDFLVEWLELSVRVQRVLKTEGITMVGQIYDVPMRHWQYWGNFGEKSRRELALAIYGSGEKLVYRLSTDDLNTVIAFLQSDAVPKDKSRVCENAANMLQNYKNRRLKLKRTAS